MLVITDIYFTVPTELLNVNQHECKSQLPPILEGFSFDLISKTELIATIRERGLSVTDRTLTYYSSEGLIPPSIRVGARGAAYPFLTCDLLTWILGSRDRSVSIDALRELKPLWLSLYAAQFEGVIELDHLERIARSTIRSREANFEVPVMINELFSGLCPSCRSSMLWRLKDGSEMQQATDGSLTLSFILGDLDDATGVAHTLAWTQLRLPLPGEQPDRNDPATIILGVPLDADFNPVRCNKSPVSKARTHSSRSSRVSTHGQGTTGQQDLLCLSEGSAAA
jgi:DNA-binding transcriptional MerR regulator